MNATAPGIDAVAPDSEDSATSAGAEDPRYAAMRADVEARLRSVSTGMSPELFTELVHCICSRKVRWARESAAPVFGE